MNDAAELLKSDFATLTDLLKAHARERGDHIALIQGDRRIDYHSLDTLVDRAAASLQRDGVRLGDRVAVVAATSIEYITIFLGSLRAGAAIVPLAPSSTGEALAAMIEDAEASVLFLDKDAEFRLDGVQIGRRLVRVRLDGGKTDLAFPSWLAPEGASPAVAKVKPNDIFNIIYSSGTTGTPKGIMQSQAMRWSHIRRGVNTGYAPDAVTLISTPLYSNTTLVSFVPALAFGGTLVLMAKFDAAEFLRLAAQHRVTHAMLVPVQYQRLMAEPSFDQTDLSSFRMKTSTSAPFAARLKEDVLRRWPGSLVEIYGMTEGGGTMTLAAHLYPDKLHTVGKPVDGHIIRIIDENDREADPGQSGEIVGHSPAMMIGYLNRPEDSRSAEWFDTEGRRYIRTGDVGRFDEDGFLTLIDRKKDMIISGGFNIYPTDLERELREHPDISDAAVVGIPSDQWGETPVAYVVRKPGRPGADEELRNWVNARVGKTQRLHAVETIEDLPRSPIGKVLKRELRAKFLAERQP